MSLQKTKEPAHKDFAKRLVQACDGNANVPLPNHGRLRWFVDQLDEQFGIKSTPETIRKWMAGEALPRHKSIHALAQTLKVDEAWLSIGKAPELDERQQKLRNAQADGAVNVVTGFIQMGGGHPAFPEEKDQRARDEHIDIYAIIKGAQYAFHIAVATQEESGWRFAIPIGAENTVIIGLIRTGPLSVDLLELDSEAFLGLAERKGGHFDLLVDSAYRTYAHTWRQIRTFSSRL
jgi:hypothetical protein